MDGPLKHKRILVTAAGQGIGRACADRFLRDGATVFATDIAEAGLEELESCGAEVAVIDGTDEMATTEYVESIAPLDAIVHAVGMVHDGDILSCDRKSWQQTFSVNVDSAYFVIRAVLPSMLERGAGSIVVVSSVASSLKGFPNRAAYGASKAALIGLTKAIAADYATRGIRCNTVCPGTILSPSLKERFVELGKKMGGEEKAIAAFEERQPMRRLGTPEEVASLCAFLAGDESSFISGQAYAVDGGITG